MEHINTGMYVGNDDGEMDTDNEEYRCLNKRKHNT